MSPAPKKMEPEQARANGASDRLRDRIDHGETGDKVDFSDPAVAPLGTDAEAGGEATRELDAPDRSRHEATERPRTPVEIESRVVTLRRLTIIFAVVLGIALVLALILAGISG